MRSLAWDPCCLLNCFIQINFSDSHTLMLSRQQEKLLKLRKLSNLTSVSFILPPIENFFCGSEGRHL